MRDMKKEGLYLATETYLTLENVADIEEYQRMIKTLCKQDIDRDRAIQELISMGADHFIREH